MQNQVHSQPALDIVGDFLGVVRAALGQMAFPADTERTVETQLRQRWGGQEAYIKKNDIDVDARALAIRSRYNMVNRRELMAEFGISRAQFYKILKGG